MQVTISKRITVVIVDDDRGARAVVRGVLKSCADITIVAEGDDGRQAMTLAKMFHPDVIVMDKDMPVMNGIEAAREILRLRLSTKILMFSASAEKEPVDRGRSAGVVGWIGKNDAGKLPEAIRCAHAG
ncbi:MAG: response regulator transcription factor [Opitutaceae bacterium]|nr:response regulator transcription factor [Opitutaceae bacterium]